MQCQNSEVNAASLRGKKIGELLDFPLSQRTEKSDTPRQLMMSQGAAPYGILLLLLTALLAAKVVADNPEWDLTVTTLAGSGTRGFEDGSASTAKLGQVHYLVGMPNGNVLIAEFDNNVVRMIYGNGTVSALAGNGTRGYLDGPGPSAMFNGPEGLAMMQNGSVVVAGGYNRMRLIAPDGTVTTLAGKGVWGTDDGSASDATFARPIGMDVLPNGSIVIAEFDTHRIRMVTPDGTVSTVTGTTAGYLDGPRATAKLNQPYDVAVMANGSLVVSDMGNHRIRLVAPDGAITTLAGTGTAGFLDGLAATAQFAYPGGVAVLKSSHHIGYIAVTDNANNRIRLIGPGGYVSTLAGGSSGFIDGPKATARFLGPIDIHEMHNGSIVVADHDNYRIRMINFADVPCTTAENCSNHASSVSGTIQTNCSCVCSTGYAGATCNACATNYYGYPSCVPIPCTIATNCNSQASSVSGNLVDGCSCECLTGFSGATCDTFTINPEWDLTVTTLAGNGTRGFEDGSASTAKLGQVHYLVGMPNGNVLIAEFDNNVVRMIYGNGTVSALAGNGTRGYLDGPGPSAMFNGPEGLAMMQNGSVVVAGGYNRMRLIAPDGTVTTLAGKGVWGADDGSASDATFGRPVGMDVLPNGSIVIAEFDTHRIRMVTPDGTVSTVTGTTAGYLDGPRATAKLNQPYDVAVMANGSLVVSDMRNHRIRLVAPDGAITTLAGTGTAGFPRWPCGDRPICLPWWCRCSEEQPPHRIHRCHGQCQQPNPTDRP